MPGKVCPTCGRIGCREHERKPWANRGDRRQRLPRDWPRLRLQILDRDPVCRACGAAPSTDVDHIERGDDHRPENLQGLCRRCHRTKTAREGNEARAARAARVP